MSNFMDDARDDAIVELSTEMKVLAYALLNRHGPDPENQNILAAAIAMMINDIGAEAFPGFRGHVNRILLSQENSNAN